MFETANDLRIRKRQRLLARRWKPLNNAHMLLPSFSGTSVIFASRLLPPVGSPAFLQPVQPERKFTGRLYLQSTKEATEPPR